MQNQNEQEKIERKGRRIEEKRIESKRRKRERKINRGSKM